MRHLRMLTLTLGMTTLAAGCGTGASTPAPNVAAYQQLVTGTRVTVDQHRTAAANMTASGCAADSQSYRAKLQGQLDQMKQMSGGMDACATAMGHSGGMMSMCTSMQDELAHHLAVACSGSDGDIQAELTRHCDAMDAMLGQMANQANQMSGMMGGGTTGGGGGGRMGGGMNGGGMGGGGGMMSSGTCQP